MADASERRKAWAKVVAQAWEDDEFKEKLLANPKRVLKENGVEFPEGTEVKVQEALKNEVTLILPLKPDSIGTLEELHERFQASSSIFI